MADEHTPFVNRLQRQDYRHPERPVDRRGNVAVEIDRLEVDAVKVRQTLESEGWALIQGLLERVHQQHMSKLKTDAAHGNILDHAAYASKLAFVAGLEQSRVAAESFTLALQAAREARDNPK